MLERGFFYIYIFYVFLILLSSCYSVREGLALGKTQSERASSFKSGVPLYRVNGKSEKLAAHE